MGKGRNWLFGIFLGLILLILGSPMASAQQMVNLGALQDMTGATSDVGKDEALGVREAVQYYNDHGGINGKRIKLFQYDYGYRVPEAVITYKRSRDYDKAVMVLGWGTGDTEALSPTINADKMPYLSSSFSGALAIPRRPPTILSTGRIIPPLPGVPLRTGSKKSGRKTPSGRRSAIRERNLALSASTCGHPPIAAPPSKPLRIRPRF